MSGNFEEELNPVLRDGDVVYDPDDVQVLRKDGLSMRNIFCQFQDDGSKVICGAMY